MRSASASSPAKSAHWSSATTPSITRARVRRGGSSITAPPQEATQRANLPSVLPLEHELSPAGHVRCGAAPSTPVFIITAKKTNADSVHSPKALPPRMVFQTGEQGQQGHGANERKTAATGAAGSTPVGVIMGCVAKQEAGGGGGGRGRDGGGVRDNCDSS